jgi:tRNA(fMet)-specific endonuclease VapC
MIGDSAALDTNVAIQLLNDVPEILRWLGQFRLVVVPVPVIGELNYGARNAAKVDENLSRLGRLLERCPPLDVNAATADVYGRIRLELRRIGRPIPENDLWIAAVCIQHGVPLATHDAHFAGLPGLVVATP